MGLPPPLTLRNSGRLNVAKSKVQVRLREHVHCVNPPRRANKKKRPPYHMAGSAQRPANLLLCTGTAQIRMSLDAPSATPCRIPLDLASGRRQKGERPVFLLPCIKLGRITTSSSKVLSSLYIHSILVVTARYTLGSRCKT